MLRPTSMSIACVVALLLQAAAAQAQNAVATADTGVFTLGQVTVVGERTQDDDPSDNRVSAAEVWDYNANTLTDAVKLVPGVTSTFISNGRRNEGDISVRGFDRWRVPLFIDGVRIYLPADNRIDFNRFLTSDLAEVQVQKGYVSVLAGPGAMGGAINLVTRKPTKDFEAEVQGGATFGEDMSYEGWFGTALLGMRKGDWYFQASATENKQDYWMLSNNFKPVGPAEDGGERNGSYSTDWRVNAKIGYQPNQTDEYSISYTKQDGKKGAPLGVDFLLPDGSVKNPPYQPNNFWTWPYWNVDSVYWLSNTDFGNSVYMKTRLSYSEFDNALYAWDDATYSSQSLNGRFRSFYADSSLGGSIETGMSLYANSITSVALHFRQDTHSEYNDNRPTNPAARTIEPKQHNEEQTWSLALQHDWHVASAVELVGGVSYDKNTLKLAEEYNTTQGLYNYPLGSSHAFNGQLEAQWHYATNAELDFSVSSRTRFPTNFERYSTRFGTALPNPDLSTERATNYEVDWKLSPVAGAKLQASVFYTQITDLIQTVIVIASPQTTQDQNVGDGHDYGLELSGEYELSPQLRLGANYSYLNRKVTDALQPNLQVTGAPNHLGFVWLAWKPLEAFTVQPNLEFSGNRWTDYNGGTTLGYQRIGEYTLVNMQLSWRPRDNIEAVLGGRNLLDRNYSLAAGFPEPGRSVYTKVRVTF